MAAIALLAVLVASTVPATAQLPLTSRKNRIPPGQRILGLDPRWTLKFDSVPAAPAGFDQERAYVALKDGSLEAVDLETGTRRWKAQTATTTAPATGDGFVFVASGDEMVALIDRSGDVAWKQGAGAVLAGPTLFDAGMLLVSRTDNEVLALRASDGTVLWRRDFGAPLAVTVAAAGDRFYLALTDTRVLAVDRDSGEPIWTVTVDNAATGVLALDDQLVIGTRGNRVYSLKPDNGRLRWTWQLGGDVTGPAFADERHIYVAALDNVLRALDRKSGNIRWTAPLPSRPLGGPVRTGDVVIVPTLSADIGAYLVETGKPAFTIKAAGEQGSVPFLRDSVRPTATRLVAVSRDGMLQGFAARYEPPPVAFDTLPGSIKVASN
jgi:outer membrane protein assembly factor BamB